MEKNINKYCILCFLLLGSFFSNCGNKCKNERFYCRDETIIDKERNIRLVKIFYNGELLEEFFFSNFYEKDSSYTDYYNGIKRFTIQLKNGKMNGAYVVFYPNGDTNYVQNYKNDTLNGYSRGFYTNKKIKYKCLFINGECVEKNNYDSIK